MIHMLSSQVLAHCFPVTSRHTGTLSLHQHPHHCETKSSNLPIRLSLGSQHPVINRSSIMCIECDAADHELHCTWCGIDCFGNCKDPDSCPSCWTPMGMDTPWTEMAGDDATPETCLDERCRCGCHDGMLEAVGKRWEAGVMKSDEQHGDPFIREGVFPLMRLALELRRNIYDFAFLQEGKQRICPNHRGTIHTALLRTCRKVSCLQYSPLFSTAFGEVSYCDFNQQMPTSRAWSRT